MADASHPYDRPTDPAKRHSAGLTDGPDRAGARSMLKAVGFTDEDLAKPLVGVGTTWIETMPCNLNQRRLAEHVKDGIRAAGGTPMEFNTISVSDGVSDGHRGDEGEPRQPRGHRRLDRARRARPPARRRRLPDRLRQDDARRGHGARPARRPGPRALQRHDLPRRVQGPAQRDGGDRLRGDRRVPGRQDQPRRAVRGRERGLPRRRRVRRAVHGEHDVDRPRVHRPVAGRAQRDPGRGPGQGRRGLPLRRDRHGPPPRATSGPSTSSRGPPSRTASRRWPRRAARRTACCTSSRSPTSSASRSTSTSSGRWPTGRRSSAT